VDILLRDNSPAVVGSASVAFNMICPNNHALTAKHFRRLCEALPDVEEWSQIILIDILLRYTVARHGFVRESILFANDANDSNFCSVMRRCYVEGQELGSGDGVGIQESELGTCKNEDVDILLRCTAPLLWSQNSAVVLAAAGVHWIMGPAEELKKIVKPILFLLRSSSAAKYVVISLLNSFLFFES
jgi:AP-3 complex subunit beta